MTVKVLLFFYFLKGNGIGIDTALSLIVHLIVNFSYLYIQCKLSVFFLFFFFCFFVFCKGKWTGMVGTSAATGASLAVNYAHSPSRYWENDADMEDDVDTELCSDIASQLVEEEINNNIRVDQCVMLPLQYHKHQGRSVCCVTFIV